LPEWLIERGIGETRAALVDGGAIVEARIELDGTVPAGSVVRCRLVDAGRHGRNALARDEDGTEYLLPTAPSGVSEGQDLAIEVVREFLPGPEPWKRPLGRLAAGDAAAATPLDRRLGGRLLPFPPAGADPLTDAGWEDLLEEVRSACCGFAGGSLSVHPTPAMTLIDVDGTLAPDELAITGAAAAARTIRRLGIGGSIGIDLPTAARKSSRLAAAEQIDALLPQPFERTAVNGFGFVQIVRPRRGASLPEIWSDAPAAEARALLRRAALARPGPVTLVAHPAVIAALRARSLWLDSLARQVGGDVRLRDDPMLAMSGGHAEAR
jgi:ribonuclease G